MLKNKNNFEIVNSVFHCSAENFSDHPRNYSNFKCYHVLYIRVELIRGWCPGFRSDCKTCCS